MHHALWQDPTFQRTKGRLCSEYLTWFSPCTCDNSRKRPWGTCKLPRGVQNRLETTFKAREQFPAAPCLLCPRLENRSEKHPKLLETHVKC